MLRMLLAILCSALCLSTETRADITIPVTIGPTPTCVGQLYQQILVPSRWGNDDGAATRFVQSPEGVLGVTIFFEIGPYGDLNSYDYNGKQAMFGVGEVSINRWRNNDSIENVNNHGEQAKGGIIAVIKESQAWHHETYDGSGTLLEGQRNRFYSILNGDPNSLDCKGLIGSWMIGQSVIYQYYGTSNIPPSYYNWSQAPAQNALFYGSSSYGNITLPGVSTANSRYVQAAGSWSVPKFPSGSYLENFFLLTNAQSRFGYPPFI